MHVCQLDLIQLAVLLGDRLAGVVSDLSVKALGASSRETPWRVDFSVDGSATTVLLRYGKSCCHNEVVALRGMEPLALPTPGVLIWDEDGEALGTPLFVSEFIEGESLLPFMKAGQSWAIDLYIDTACAVQSIQPGELPDGVADRLEVGESALEVLSDAYAMFAAKDALIDDVHAKLLETAPPLPAPQFSNGDLWPDNLLVREQQLVGIIDWQHAGFSDPLFEFLLPFFLVPELRGLGIEARFCKRKGFEPRVLHWYHGLEFFDSLRWVCKTGKPYEIHTEESLRADLEAWLRE